MIIGGFQKVTLIDYPKKISSTIFVQGCNFRCPFCYNPQLVLKKVPAISEEEIFSYLEKRKRFIDAVVICGGEPTIYNDLPEFCKKIKELGFLIKIDTNGSNPEMLQTLIKNKLVDYIAMDIKTTIKQDDYERVAQRIIDIEQIKQSIEIIKQIKNYEFRTTCVPGIITEEKLMEIAQYLKESQANKLFSLQQFQPQNTLIEHYEKIEPYTKQELKKFQKALKPYFEQIHLRI
ncbi:MAG: anaerobic ribonucleoside-triphosphate reductase activating protein [Candidatus Pacearchaeota archaeon]|nr:MAG: anaerobic ribonucleoside-triphosphate reductase activating protein [Candidatus Pacearchaeota archaeon]